MSIIKEKYIAILANAEVNAFNKNSERVESFITKYDKIYPFSSIIDPQLKNDYIRISLTNDVWTWMDVDRKFVYKINLEWLSDRVWSGLIQSSNDQYDVQITKNVVLSPFNSTGGIGNTNTGVPSYINNNTTNAGTGFNISTLSWPFLTG